MDDKLDALSAETKKLETIYRQKLADLEELKKSALKKTFNGGLQLKTVKFADFLHLFTIMLTKE